MEVTRHAKKRIKSRLGLPSSQAEKYAKIALDRGVTAKESKGELSRYFSKLYLKYETANNIRIYCDHVYIFCGNVLVTVYVLPSQYKKTVKKILERRKKQND